MWWGAAIFAAALLAYGGMLARFIPERLHFAANIIISIAAIIYGYQQGLDFEDMGLSIHFIIPGIVVTLAASLFVMIGAALTTLVKPLHAAVTAPVLARPGKIAYQTAVRIPLSTALSEEILFRGVLLGLLLAQSHSLLAIGLCSLVFGLWHALPSLRDHHRLAAVPIIVATAIAGGLFCWLRLVSGSIIAPWLLHWTLNASGMLAVHTIHKRQHDNRA